MNCSIGSLFVDANRINEPVFRHRARDHTIKTTGSLRVFLEKRKLMPHICLPLLDCDLSRPVPGYVPCSAQRHRPASAGCRARNPIHGCPRRPTNVRGLLTRSPPTIIPGSYFASSGHLFMRWKRPARPGAMSRCADVVGDHTLSRAVALAC